ncbi:lamin tail domain-containing protein [Cryomorphaceae bacterium 1068]|nr:lamin tail domain-containing protein [Cryomorphaceae bacterium 1068]
MKSTLLFVFFSLIILATSTVSAQVSDDFSDGDFTNGTLWTGDDAFFTVDGGILRSNIDPGDASINYYISTANVLVDDVQWEFWINLDFATSGANYVDVFVMADNADLSAAANGYFIRFGDTADEISFYKLSAGSESTLIDGSDGELGSSNNIYKVRLTRTTAGLWTLELDEDNTGVFAGAGSVIDGDITSTSHFGFRIEQSSAASPVNNHFFDDIEIGLIPVDEDPPELISANAVGATEVVLQFSEALEETSAGNIANYSIDGGIGNPATAMLDGGSPNTVNLSLASPLNNGQQYAVTVSGVVDLSGNVANGETADFTFFIPDNPSPGDVIFNELFPDPSPSVGLPESEYIEIYNRSESFFDTEDWILVNTTTERILPSISFPPNSYLILCDASNVDVFASFGTVVGITSFTALANAADSLTLVDGTGEILDIVSYTDNWYQDPDKDEGGYSLERINPILSCSGATNWAASSDPSGGTPGSQNSLFDDAPDTTPPSVISVSVIDPLNLLIVVSEPLEDLNSASIGLDQGISINEFSLVQDDQIQVLLVEPLQTGVAYEITVTGLVDCEGNVSDTETLPIFIGELPAISDLIITEIMADPTPSIGLPEGEYFELFNNSDKTLELQGSELSGVFFEESIILQPGDYVAFASISNAELFDNLEGIRFLDMSTSFLTNGGRELTLTNSEGEQLDFVEYSDDWYSDSDKDDGGYSLELINPNVACSGAFNWSASNSPLGGTPGEQNSIFNDDPDETAPTLVSFSIPQDNEVQLTFSEPLDEESINGIVANFAPESSVAGIFQVQPDGLLIELIIPFEVGTVYSLELTGVTDCAGNEASAITVDILLGVSPEVNEILITEIMADPSPSVGLPEGEYFELFNASNVAIDLFNCSLSGVEFEESVVIAPGEYLFFASISNQVAFLTSPDVIFLENMSTTFLTNGGRELELLNPEGERVDRVNYDLSWYNDGDKEDGGYSLERINLSEPCRGADNWTGTEAEFGGTPGAQNSVYSEDPDLMSPEIDAVFAQGSNLIEVRFSEVIDSLSVLLTDITITPEVGVDAVFNAPPDYSSLLIQLIEPLEEGVRYELSLEGISDCVGNEIESTESFVFAIPQPGEPGDLLINEVLFNPRTAGRDFVEIYNASDKNIGLKNWVLQNADLTTRVISEDPLVIFPGQHLVLTDDVNATIQEYPMSGAYRENFHEMESLPSYNNGEGSVILADSLENPIDRFDYLEDYHFPLLNTFDRVSLERLSYTRPTNEPGNWSSASERVGFATPGYVNSQFLPEGRASAQFELEDEVFSPDNDGFEDVLLINYSLDGPDYLATIRIYDRRGRLIRELTNNLLLGTEGTLSWDGTTDDRSKARIGPHIILIEIFNPAGDTETFKIPCIVAGNLSN